MTQAVGSQTTTPIAQRGRLSRGQVYGILFIAAGALIALLFGLGVPAGARTTFGLGAGGIQAGDAFGVTVPTSLMIWLLALVSAFMGGVQLARGFKRLNLALGVAAMVFILAFLTWAAAGQSINLTVLLSSALLRAAPIALAALSGVLCERCGVINIGIEGMMLGGAFSAAFMGSLAANIWGWGEAASLAAGLAAALLMGGLLGLLLAVLAVRFKINQIIAGTGINILAAGLTSFLSGAVLKEFTNLNSAPILRPVPIPGLAQIPVIGPVLFDQNLFIYLMFLLLAGVHVMLFYTRWGLRTRAVGEHPKAADTLGVDVLRVRYVNVVLGGVVAGLAGAFLVLGSVGRFDELMTAGKGFIGLAAMIFGKWTPLGSFAAALIFGFADTLQTRLAILSVPIPSQFLLMAPYLVTVVVLAGVVGEAVPPAADGQPYEKE